MLDSHPALAVGPETHFFNKTNRADRLGALRDPASAAALLATLRFAGERVIEVYGVSESDLRADLEARRTRRPLTEADLLDALVRPYANRYMKPRWGEKTPGHTRYLTEIRSAFPQSRLIHIVRDPRDAAVSICRLPWASESPLANAYLWRDRVRPVVADDGVLMVRFEDLVAEPERELARICDFIDEAYSPAMLDRADSAARIQASGETWKTEVKAALNPAKCYRWRREPLPSTNAIGALCASEIEAFGYPTAAPPTTTLRGIGLTQQAVESAQDELLSLAGQGVAVVPASPSDRPGTAGTVVCTVPDLGRGRWKRARALASFITSMAVSRATGRPVQYLGSVAAPVGGRASTIASALVCSLGTPIDRQAPRRV